MDFKYQAECRDIDRVKQAVIFKGIVCWGTDLDGIIEYHDKGYIIMEFKYKGIDLFEDRTKIAQRLTLERLTDTLNQAGKPTICLVASHETPPSLPINAVGCPVYKYRFRKAWYEPKEQQTIGEMASKFIQFLDGK